MIARVLVIDDDPKFGEFLCEVLGDEGYQVELAISRSAGLEALRSRRFDVLVVDEYLEGISGPALAVTFLTEAQEVQPGARAIIVSGWPDDANVQAGFDVGAEDYLIKGPGFTPSLKAKIRGAATASRADHLLGAKRSTVDAEINELRSSLGRGTSQERGRALEEMLVRLFRTVPDLTPGPVRWRNRIEEWDLVQFFESGQPYSTDCLLVECKNWSKSVGAKEWGDFERKLRRHRSVRQGMFVSIKGFTEPFREGVRNAEGLPVVAFIDLPAIDAWIAAPDRSAWLHQRLRASVLPP